MVMTSDQIAQMTSMGQQQAMMGMQHSAMISGHAGQPFAPGGMTTGEAAMGRMTNMGASVGMPIMAAGAGLLGVDPMSLAMRGVFSGSMGGAAMGLGAASGVGAGLMAAQYAGKQAFIGMQQQQALNQALSNTYQFQGQTQRGFTLGQSSDIGQMMRQMAMTKGVGGEYTSMEQLTGLASSMGQMGMMRGVNDLRDFSRKFSEMVKTVKEVATAFNTNLEEALQITSGMRNAGIFKNQGQVAQNVATWARAGGIATQEVMQSMQMGSQLSRMIGGRGAAGAIAGMKTMGQIGVMEQMGMLSEEQLYNLTGQTGAAGRQALASQQMQQSAQFLRSALGRRAIASMAGAGGHVDAESVAAWQQGGVGTGDTMQMAYKNLAKVGRAGFIRNEGRLRGEVMAQFGGNAGVAVMSQWLEQRGMDPGDDRGLILMSRRLGISTEEAEQQLKQYRMRDLLENKRADTATDAQMWSRIEQQKAGSGIQGIKKSLEGFKNELNNKIQQWGADLYTEGSNFLERWFNTATGQFVTRMDRDIGSAIRNVMSGTDAAAQRVAEERFGMGRGLLGQKYFGLGEKAIMQGANTASMGALEAAGASGDLKRLKKAGFEFVAESRTDAEYKQRLAREQKIGGAFETGLAMGAGDLNLDPAMTAKLRRAAAMGELGGEGSYRTQKKIQRLLEEEGTDKGLKWQWDQSSRTGKAGMMGQMAAAGGFGEMFRNQIVMPELQGIEGQGFRTDMDRNMAIGSYMLGATGLGRNPQKVREEQEAAKTAGSVGKWGARIVGGIATLGIGFAVGGTMAALGGPDPTESFGKYVEGKFREGAGGVSEEVMRGAGEFISSEKGRDLSIRALSRDANTRRNLVQDIEQRNIELQTEAGGVKNMNRVQQSEFEANRALLAAGAYAELMESTGGKPTADQIRRAATGAGFPSPEAFVRGAQAVGGAAKMGQDAARQELIRRERGVGQKNVQELQRGGMVDESGKLTAKAREYFGGIKGLGLKTEGWNNVEVTSVGERQQGIGEKIAEAAIQAQTERAKGTEEGTQKARELEQKVQDMTSTLTTEQKTELMKATAGKGGVFGAMSKELGAGLGLEKKLKRFGGKGAGAGMMRETAGILGVQLDKSEMVEWAKMDPARAAEMMASRTGMGMEGAGKQALEQYFTKMKEGKTGEAADIMQKLRSGKGAAGEEFGKAQVEKQEAELKANDPTYRALTEIKTALEPLKKMTEDKTQNVNIVQSVAIKTEASPAPESDERLKEDLAPLEEPVESTLKLRGVRFKWRGSGAVDVGLIAQDVKAIIPEAVHKGENGFLRVEYHKVIPLLVEAIRELKGQLDDLHATVDELSADLGR